MLTSNGFEIKRLQDILDDLKAAQRLIFPNINLDPSSPDGQLNGIISELIAATHEAILAVYNGLDPRTATGIMLDRVSAINSIKRLNASGTIVDVTFTGLANTLILEGTQVSASLINDVVFKTIEDVTIATGQTTASVEVKATTDGPISVEAGAIDTIVNPVVGISSVMNILAGITGRDLETDQQLRIRREKSVAILSNALIDSIIARVGNVEGVKDVAVYENKTSSVDAKGIDPHAIWVVVNGGLDNDIADAIMRTVSLGAGFTGTEVVPWEDANGFSHDVKFDRAEEKNIYVSVEIVSPSYNASFGEEIKQKIVDYVDAVRAGTVECSSGSFSIADVVYASALYPAVIGSPDYTVSSILVSLVSPGTAQSIVLSWDEIAKFDTSLITIVVL